MAPLPESNTRRYKMIYTVGTEGHSMTARATPTFNDGVAAAHFDALFAAVAASLGSNTSWVGLEVAPQGSNVFNPIGGFTGGTGGGGAVAAVDQPRAMCFAGRTSGGRRTKVFLYGVDSGFVTTAAYSEDPLVTATFQGFQGLLVSQADFWLGIDGIKPSWYFRMTIKPNDHWIDAQR